MNRFFNSISLLLAVFVWVGSAYANDYRVGHQTYSMWEQKDSMRLDISLWYPTRSLPSSHHLGDYLVEMAKDSPVLKLVDEQKAKPYREEISKIKEDMQKEGKPQKEINEAVKKIILPHLKLPFILLTPSSNATRYSYHTLASRLAQMGYLVAVPDHINDNIYTMPHQNSVRSLLERAKQITFTLDLFLSDEYVSSYIDRDKIIYLGFGNAGMAGFLLRGVKFNADNWESYCQAYMGIKSLMLGQALSPLVEKKELQSDNFSFSIDFENVNPYCFEPLNAKMELLVLDLKNTIQKTGQDQKTFEELLLIKQEKMQEIEDEQKDLQMSSPFVLPFLPPVKNKFAFEQSEFSKFIFVSPGISFLFDEDDLASLNVPSLLVGLQADKLNLPQYQAEKLFKSMNNSNTIYQTLMNVDIFGLQAPCSENELLVEICQTVSDKQRKKSLHELSNLIDEFVKMD